ncbi:MAG: glycosyltransferase family 2 protein [Chloroflexi bacterium]|nr:glycosyltransferase family 2 protein [Chloroflexota bacterium]
MAMNTTASIITLNWNGKPYLEDCLSSVMARTYPDFEVVLVDNGSTDGSAEFVAQRFPQVRIIRHDENLGFAAGNNTAIRATRSPYVATFLNNDAQAEPTWLAELVEAMESDDQVGMCASKMLFAHRPEVIDSSGLSPDVAGIAWNRRWGERDVDDDAGPTEVFGACAGAALYRHAMLGQIGLFDEDFFAYLEDADLAWRARLAGWKCLYVPSAVAYHVHSATGGVGSPFKNYLLGRNKIWTIVKNYPSPQLFCYLPLIVACDLAAVAYGLLVRGDISPLRGRLAALGALPAAWQKRRAIQR